MRPLSSDTTFGEEGVSFLNSYQDAPRDSTDCLILHSIPADTLNNTYTFYLISRLAHPAALQIKR